MLRAAFLLLALSLAGGSIAQVPDKPKAPDKSKPAPKAAAKAPSRPAWAQLTGDQQMPYLWLHFRDAVRTAPELDVARLVRSGCHSTLAGDVLAAYDAPFPDETYKAAPRAMPDLVPTSPEDPASAANRAAWQRLSTWDKPFLVAFSDGDPITSGMGPVLHRVVPGAESVTIAGGGHFLQEDTGEELAFAIAGFTGS